jgi:hypothetical protein
MLPLKNFFRLYYYTKGGKIIIVFVISSFILIPFYLLIFFGRKIAKDKIKFLKDRVIIVFENGNKDEFIVNEMSQIKLYFKESNEPIFFSSQ